MNRGASWGAAVVAGVLLAAAGCKSGPPVQEEKSVALKNDGLPLWLDQPCVGQPVDALCAAGESDFAAADVEAAKTDAETAAKNRIADQLQARNTRLTERYSNALKDLGNGKVLGQRSLADINRNFNEQALQGLRYTEYFYYPDRVNPRKVYVRAVLTQDSTRHSQQILDAMLSAAQAEQLKLNHREAQLRLEAVRQQYLAEEADRAQRATAPAP